MGVQKYAFEIFLVSFVENMVLEAWVKVLLVVPWYGEITRTL
jgi:hypothetical protein